MLNQLVERIDENERQRVRQRELLLEERQVQLDVGER